jgi:hypothetical protein
MNEEPNMSVRVEMRSALRAHVLLRAPYFITFEIHSIKRKLMIIFISIGLNTADVEVKDAKVHNSVSVLVKKAEHVPSR